MGLSKKLCKLAYMCTCDKAWEIYNLEVKQTDV
jgi:hypothetical protein